MSTSVGNRFQTHFHSVLRPQRDQRPRGDLLKGIEGESPFLSNSCEKQYSLAPGEALTDAAPDTRADRDVDELLSALLDRFFRPPIRGKSFRVLPKPRVAVEQILARENG